MHQKNVNLSAFLFSHKKQDVAFRMNIWQEDFRHEIFAAGKASRYFREGFFKTENPAWFRCRIFMRTTFSGAGLVDPDAWHGRERRLVPVHFDHDLSGHVGVLVVTQGIVGRYDGGNAPVLFQP